MRELLPRRAEGIELDRAVALLQRRAGGVADAARRALDRVPAVRVRRDAIADRATEELIHGHAERLPDDVPAGHVDHGERGHRDLPRARVIIANHAARERLEREGIGADNVSRHSFVEVSEKRAGVVDHAHFADALDPVVGAHHDEGEVAPGCAEHERADLGDLHPLIPVVTIPRTMKRCAKAKNAMSGRTYRATPAIVTVCSGLPCGSTYAFAIRTASVVLSWRRSNAG